MFTDLTKKTIDRKYLDNFLTMSSSLNISTPVLLNYCRFIVYTINNEY